jgi:hypothetical protein
MSLALLSSGIDPSSNAHYQHSAPFKKAFEVHFLVIARPSLPCVITGRLAGSEVVLGFAHAPCPPVNRWAKNCCV